MDVIPIVCAVVGVVVLYLMYKDLRNAPMIQDELCEHEIWSNKEGR